MKQITLFFIIVIILVNS